MKVLPLLDFSDRDKEEQMNVRAKDEFQSDGPEVESSFEEGIGGITGESNSETGGEIGYRSGEVEGETGALRPEHGQVARLAYEHWQQRGCPFGTPEEDWFHAEEQIKQTLSETPVSPDRGKTVDQP